MDVVVVLLVIVVVLAVVLLAYALIRLLFPRFLHLPVTFCMVAICSTDLVLFNLFSLTTYVPGWIVDGTFGPTSTTWPKLSCPVTR